MTDADRMDNADAVAHYYHQNTTQQTWNFNFSGSAGSSIFATVVAFSSQNNTPPVITASTVPVGGGGSVNRGGIPRQKSNWFGGFPGHQ